MIFVSIVGSDSYNISPLDTNRQTNLLLVFLCLLLTYVLLVASCSRMGKKWRSLNGALSDGKMFWKKSTFRSRQGNSFAFVYQCPKNRDTSRGCNATRSSAPHVAQHRLLRVGRSNTY